MKNKRIPSQDGEYVRQYVAPEPKAATGKHVCNLPDPETAKQGDIWACLHCYKRHILKIRSDSSTLYGNSDYYKVWVRRYWHRPRHKHKRLKDECRCRCDKFMTAYPGFGPG